MTKIRVIGCAKGCMADGEPPERGEYIFTEEECNDYDWLVVYDEFPRRRKMEGLKFGKFKLDCPRERTILVTQEPVSVKFYNRVYTSQFGHLLTNRPKSAENHPGYFFGRGYYVWFTGRDYVETRNFAPPEKTKLVSAVYSTKKMKHTHHHARSVLLDRLMEKVDGLDRFGKGIKEIKYKYDALDSYKYHIAVENHIAEGHWSEKIADALLCECLPFYAGDPSIADVLPKKSFIEIPIDDPDKAANIINSSIKSNEYEKRLPAIREARNLLQYKYNFRDQIIELIESSKITAFSKNSSRISNKDYGFIMTRKRTRLSPTGAFSDFTHHVLKFFKSL